MINGTLAEDIVVTIDSWANRPASATDGDWFQVTGKAVYRYSSIVNEWVRPNLYEGTLVLDGAFDGTVDPDTVGWTHSLTGASATVASDGTHVVVTTTSNAHNASVTLTHGQSGKNHFVQGYMQVVSRDSGTNTNACMVFIYDSDYGNWLSLQASGTGANAYARLTDGSNKAGFDVSLATEKWVEMFTNIAEDRVTVYIDHSLAPILQWKRSAMYNGDTTSEIYILGDGTGQGYSVTKYRNVSVGRY